VITKEVNTITEYMNLQTKLPPYLPFARFLLKADLSMTAKIVYSLLLDRMTLSQKSGWADEKGRSYILYPIERIAEDIDRGQTAVKSALTELSAKGLIVRQRTGFDKPNRIYVLLPDGRDAEFPTGGNQSPIQTENGTSYGRESDCTKARNPTPNYRNKNHIEYIKNTRSMIPDYNETEGDSL